MLLTEWHNFLGLPLHLTWSSVSFAPVTKVHILRSTVGALIMCPF